MTTRRYFEQSNILEELSCNEAQRLRESAELLPQGPIREAAIRKARQMETTSHIVEWLSSPALQAPK